MALVAYDNSDTSDFEEDDQSATTAVSVSTVEEKIVHNPTTTQTASSEQELGDQTLFNRLPQPSTAKKSLIEEDDEFLHKKVIIKAEPKPKSKITVPSLNDFKDVENSVPSTKPKTIGEKKSGLLSILPQPKNGVKSTTKSLIPHVLTQKPETSTVKKKTPSKSNEVKPSSLVTEYSDESDTDDVKNDFFSIHKVVELPEDNFPLDIEKSSNITDAKKIPRSIESYFKKEDPKDTHMDQNLESFGDDPTKSDHIMPESTSNENMVLDEEAIMKLCGTRGKRRREEIQIVNVNQQEVLNDAKEWLLKGLMDDTSKRQSASKKRGNEPTSQQRRKHQITYLAHQAKANEMELENQWANSRMNKRKTQSKYGF